MLISELKKVCTMNQGQHGEARGGRAVVTRRHVHVVVVETANEWIVARLNGGGNDNDDCHHPRAHSQGDHGVHTSDGVLIPFVT